MFDMTYCISKACCVCWLSSAGLISPGVSVPIQVPGGGGGGGAGVLFDNHNTLTSHYWSSRA